MSKTSPKADPFATKTDGSPRTLEPIYPDGAAGGVPGAQPPRQRGTWTDERPEADRKPKQ
jgi:hypothetical protein